MDNLARPYRSVLYIPGSNERALEKAKGLAVDAIIFDLEDAVAIDAKAEARTLLAKMLGDGGFGPRFQIVRLNGMATEWGPADLATIAPVGPETCTGEPPKTAAMRPATIAVMRPASALRPELTPNPSASGSATMPTVSPESRSVRHVRRAAA